MLTLNQIKENTQEVLQKLSVRNKDFTNSVNKAIEYDEDRINIQKELEKILERSNKIAKSIGLLYKEGKQEEANAAKAEASKLKEDSTWGR